MRKFAANYLFSDAGILMKNGIVYADDAGNAIQFIDTKGDLRETELLAFHNGILMAGFEFVKFNEAEPAPGNQLAEKIFDSVPESGTMTILNFIELARQIQSKFPEMIIPEILRELVSALKTRGFIRESRAGIFLLSGANLPELKFTSRCRIRKIF
ncbi:MAG: hypothetical protein WAO52_10215 [Prolixibacteraceae bacterium]